MLVLQVGFVKGLDISGAEIQEAQRRFGELQAKRGAGEQLHDAQQDACCQPASQPASLQATSLVLLGSWWCFQAAACMAQQ